MFDGLDRIVACDDVGCPNRLVEASPDLLDACVENLLDTTADTGCLGLLVVWVILGRPDLLEATVDAGSLGLLAFASCVILGSSNLCDVTVDTGSLGLLDACVLKGRPTLLDANVDGGCLVLLAAACVDKGCLDLLVA